MHNSGSADIGNGQQRSGVAVLDQTGSVVDDNISVTLGPGEQIARFLDQDLSRSQFKGSIVLSGQGQATFVAVALVQNQNLFSVVPVIVGKAPSIPE